MTKKESVSFIKYITEKRITTVAGAWVFFFMLSVIPLVFLLFTAFSVFGVNLKTQLLLGLPEEFKGFAEMVLTASENVYNGATILFIFTALFSSSALLNQMSKDGDFMFNVKAEHKKGVFRRLWAILALGVVYAIFLGIAFVFSFGDKVISTIFLLKDYRVPLFFLGFFFSTIIIYGIIILLNKFISPIKLTFRQVAFGSFVSLTFIVVGTIGFIFYLRFINSYNAVYGSMAGLLVFLIWAYILMLSLVFGTIVNVYLYNRGKNYATIKPNKTNIANKKPLQKLQKGH
ncbi:MAG: YihY/virulence factor BrkB family protein [Clostridia bacterium]|nr:YihY/virulence factor BrkB family protein [Clostridia bacterium]